MSGRVSLYRHFDADGRLLYVGAAISVTRRTYRHRAMSEWFDDVRTITIEPFDSEEEALAAEIEAIRTEGPLFNTQHAPPKIDCKTGRRVSARGRPIGSGAKWPQPTARQIATWVGWWRSSLKRSEVVDLVRKDCGAEVPDHWVRDQITKATGTAARKPVEE